MSISARVISIENNQEAPVVRAEGGLGFPDLEIQKKYDDEWGVSLYSFGWFYDGLASIGLITEDLAYFKEFLEQNIDNKVVVFHEGGVYEDEVDWDNLTNFKPTPKPEFADCTVKIECLKTGETFQSTVSDDLIPQEKVLTPTDIENFISKLVTAPDIMNSMHNTCLILDEFEDFGEIKKFIRKHKDSKLKVSILEG